MTPLVLDVPGDKSIAHRALLLGALAEGESRLANVPQADDVESTMHALRSFGVAVERAGDAVVVHGRGPAGLRAARQPIDCGNSGTTARLCIGLAAALPGQTMLDGDDSLRRRPMERVVGPLRAAGASIDYLSRAGTLPLRVTGGVLAAVHDRSGTPSAQVKSALLLAGIAAGVEVSLSVAPSRDHTERMLGAMGVDLEILDRAGHGYQDIRARPTYRLEPLELAIYGDFSSAAFLIAGALLAGTPVLIPGVGVNPTRTGFLDIVRRMGARVEVRDEREQGGEPVADLEVEPSPLTGTAVGGAEIVRAIDELPLVGILAAHAEGETTVTGASELRVKESDRIDALVQNLGALGVHALPRPDGYVVRGSARPLVGAVTSFGDHRIAMGFAVLGLRPGSRIEVDDPGLARVSFPGFARQLERLRGARTATIPEGAA